MPLPLAQAKSGKEHRLCKRILANEKVRQHALWAKLFFVLSKVGVLDFC
jgi:hypothetical protein